MTNISNIAYVKAPTFSFVIPVYNRPDELQENLHSLSLLDNQDFEVIIVEDGSKVKSDEVVKDYSDRIDIKYFFKQNEGPSIGRNYGAQQASGKYLLFVDSDCIMPPDYLSNILAKLKTDTDVFGGPDRAHESFTKLQKAINFSMTNVLTTGGIRGQKKSVDRYYPRSFNLGIKRHVFLEMGGFPLTKMHPGEDMVFGIELIRRGYTTQYIHDAYVYHKRRTNIHQFYNQVRKFGKVRYYITRMYPHTWKITYLFPLAFCCFVIIALLGCAINFPYLLWLLGGYCLALLVSSMIENRSLHTALLSVMTSFIMFFAYAKGLLQSTLGHLLTGKDEYDVLGKDLFAQI